MNFSLAPLRYHFEISSSYARSLLLFNDVCCSNMVSANNTFLRPVLDMLAENFLPIPSAKIYVPPAQSAAAAAAASGLVCLPLEQK